MREVRLQALAPRFEGWLAWIVRQVLQSGVGEACGLVGRQAAKDMRSHASVHGKNPRPFARLGREGGALRQRRLKGARRRFQCLQSGSGDAASVGGRQTDATPKIGTPLKGKTGDRFRNGLDIAALDKPQASAKALIKNSAFVADQPSRSQMLWQVPAPMKKSLVKSVAVESQPAQEWLQLGAGSLDIQRQTCPAPTHPDVNHIGVRLSRTTKEPLNAVMTPGRQPIQQRQGHARSFKAEAALVAVDLIEPLTEDLDLILLERELVALHERAANPFKPRPRGGVSASKTAAGKRGFRRRNAEETFAQETGHSVHIRSSPQPMRWKRGYSHVCGHYGTTRNR